MHKGRHPSGARPGAASDPLGVGTPRTLAGESGRAAIIRQARRDIAEHRFQDAYDAIKPIVESNRPGAEALYLRAFLEETSGAHEKAALFAKRSLALQEHGETLLLLARCHRAQGDVEKAVACCDRALGMPQYELLARITKAGVLEETGRIDDAEAVLEPVLERHRLAGDAPPAAARMEHAKILVQRKRYGDAVREIDDLMSGPQWASVDEHNRRAVWYLKAKAHDRAGDYEHAHDAARDGNALAGIEYDPAFYEEQLDILRRNWSRRAMEHFPRSECESEIPVFVAGMPRSGTSLIDQIIDAHPKAAGVGELDTIDRFAMRLSEEWNPELDPPESFGSMQSKAWTKAANAYVREIRKLAPRGVERIVNKSLGNNRLVGLIAKLFPRTRIIHAIRDPRDVAVSCFMGGFNQRTFAWTQRFEHIAHAWAQSQRMMEHWRDTLDVPILDVRYEDLVSDPDTQFPRIIEFLGLEWDDACRAFHRSNRLVRTLSYDQVNRPLYTTSIGRYTNYMPWLDGVAFPAYE